MNKKLELFIFGCPPAVNLERVTPAHYTTFSRTRLPNNPIETKPVNMHYLNLRSKALNTHFKCPLSMRWKIKWFVGCWSFTS